MHTCQTHVTTKVTTRLLGGQRMVKFAKFYWDYRQERSLVLARRLNQKQAPMKVTWKLLRLCYQFGYTGSDTASILI